jgi:transposase-like protein
MRGPVHEEETMNAISQAIPQPRTKRRYRSGEERRRIVEETLVPGTSVAIVARAHGVNANQVFGWRKLYHSGVRTQPRAAKAARAAFGCCRSPYLRTGDAGKRRPPSLSVNRARESVNQLLRRV